MNEILIDPTQKKSLITDKNMKTVASKQTFTDCLDAMLVNSISKHDILYLQNNIPNLSNENNGDLYNELATKSNEYESLFKENDKLSIDMMYIDGDIQYIKIKIDRDKEQINELENLNQEGLIKLKELEYEKGVIHDKLVIKHKALKKAAKYYKKYLDFYIFVEEQENTMKVVVCYFTQKFDDTYSFVISTNINENKWKLNSTKPQLKESVFVALQNKFEITNNKVALLCTIRKIFSMYKNK